jgi:hypothetical protein
MHLLPAMICSFLLYSYSFKMRVTLQNFIDKHTID